MGAAGAQAPPVAAAVIDPGRLRSGQPRRTSDLAEMYARPCPVRGGLASRRCPDPVPARRQSARTPGGGRVSEELAAACGAAVPRGVLDAAQCQGLDAPGLPAIEGWRVRAGCSARDSDARGDAACLAHAVGDADYSVTGQAIGGGRFRCHAHAGPRARSLDVVERSNGDPPALGRERLGSLPQYLWSTVQL